MSDLLGWERSPGDCDDIKQRKEKVNAALAHRYTQLKRRITVIMILICSGEPVAPSHRMQLRHTHGINVSLAGLNDAKNRQKMSLAFRAIAVAMFCNGDVEKRFNMEEAQAMAVANYETGAGPCMCALECCCCVPWSNVSRTSLGLGLFFRYENVRISRNMYENVRIFTHNIFSQ